MLWMLRLMKRKRNGLFYSKKEETINSISHGIGIAMGVIVSTLFLINATRRRIFGQHAAYGSICSAWEAPILPPHSTTP